MSIQVHALAACCVMHHFKTGNMAGIRTNKDMERMYRRPMFQSAYLLRSLWALEQRAAITTTVIAAL